MKRRRGENIRLLLEIRCSTSIAAVLNKIGYCFPYVQAQFRNTHISPSMTLKRTISKSCPSHIPMYPAFSYLQIESTRNSKRTRLRRSVFNCWAGIFLDLPSDRASSGMYSWPYGGGVNGRSKRSLGTNFSDWQHLGRFHFADPGTFCERDRCYFPLNKFSKNQFIIKN